MPRLLIRTLLALLIAIAGGCATACHDRSCGCVPYTYCPPPPLPYRAYCGCPTPVAACYSARWQVVTLDSGTLQSPLADEPVVPSPMSR